MEIGFPVLCYITDRKNSPLPLLDSLRRGIDAGVDWIQLREKDLSARDLWALALETRGIVAGRPVRIIINGRLDVALAAGVEGVHLPASSLPVSRVREKIGDRPFLIGVSTHSPEEVLTAARSGASYVTFGPVFPTPSKAMYGPPRGLAELQQAAASVSIPLLALGGVESGNVLACLQAGARGIAAIRLFQDPEIDLQELFSGLRTDSLRKLLLRGERPWQAG
jgi:thiamine-phosphate pyrophosphorylase